MSAALEQNLGLLQQGIELLESIDDDIYRGEEEASSFRTSYRVGPHLRHCIDAYGCLLSGMADRRIDYDARDRLADIENDRLAGCAALADIAASLRDLASEDPHLELRVKVDTPRDAPGAWSRSTLRREFQFLVGHTVHHFALIALILRRDGIEPGEQFGVAESTLRHWAHEETVVG